ncbi:MAG: GNAT family N-acetyltransferase [Myxococcales bacterium]|nr:GNAT family N-acetyltransferase [Myxococcales bacterium]
MLDPRDPRPSFAIRDLTPADRAALVDLDTSFETDRVYDVITTGHRLELVERALPARVVKRYPIEDVFADWATWDIGFVAVDADDRVRAFAGLEYEPWHARLVLWHLYVTPELRGQGIARHLLAHIEAHGRRLGASRVWLETTNINVPGIAAYARLGYTLCGVDTTYYDSTPESAESAVYLSKPL